MCLASVSRPWTAGAGGGHLPTLVTIRWMDIPNRCFHFVLPAWGEDTLAQHHSSFPDILAHRALFCFISTASWGMFVSLGLLWDVPTSLCSPQRPWSWERCWGSSISPDPVWGLGGLQMVQGLAQPALAKLKAQKPHFFHRFFAICWSCGQLQLQPPLNEALTKALGMLHLGVWGPVNFGRMDLFS